MALHYSIIARESNDVGFDQLDWSLTIAESREEADELAGQFVTDDEVLEVGIAEYDDDQGCGQCGIGNICIGHIIDILPGIPGLSHDEACSSAATDQGLDPLMDAFEAAHVPYRLETTGNYAMVVLVYLHQSPHLDITSAEYGWQVTAIDSWHEPGELLAKRGSLPEVLTIIRSQPGWHHHPTDPPGRRPTPGGAGDNWFPRHNRTSAEQQPAESEPPYL